MYKYRRGYQVALLGFESVESTRITAVYKSTTILILRTQASCMKVRLIYTAGSLEARHDLPRPRSGLYSVIEGATYILQFSPRSPNARPRPVLRARALTPCHARSWQEPGLANHSTWQGSTRSLGTSYTGALAMHSLIHTALN